MAAAVMFAGGKGCEDLCETLNQDYVCLAKLALRRKAKKWKIKSESDHRKVESKSEK